MFSTAAERATTLRSFGALTAAEITEGLEQLRLYGIPETRLLALGRVGTDGQWALAVRTPTNRVLEHPDRPWLDAHAMEYGTDWHTLPSAAAILLTPNNGDQEMDRRFRLQEQQTEREQQDLADHRARQVQADQALAADQALEQEARAMFDGAAWDRLPPVAQAFYMLAIELDDQGEAKAAAAVRTIAQRISGHGDALAPLPFPRRRWR